MSKKREIKDFKVHTYSMEVKFQAPDSKAESVLSEYINKMIELDIKAMQESMYKHMTASMPAYYDIQDCTYHSEFPLCKKCDGRKIMAVPNTEWFGQEHKSEPPF